MAETPMMGLELKLELLVQELAALKQTVGQIRADLNLDTSFQLQFFAFGHLPEHLQRVSRPFGELADYIVKHLPRNPERTVALRKLLEAKDAAVRAVVAKP